MLNVRLMRLRTTLMDIAAIATTALAYTGCSAQSASPATTADTEKDDANVTSGADSSTKADADKDDANVTSDADSATSQDGQAKDAALEDDGRAVDRAPGDAQACPSASSNVTGDQACALVAQDMQFRSTSATNVVFGAACESYCDGMGICPGAEIGNPTFWRCTVAQSYVDAYDGAQPDAGRTDAGTVDAGAVCPLWSGQVLIQCGPPPTGRRTAGVAGIASCGSATVGAELAERAYLEAVSVHAFATLERELAAHGAPPALLRSVRRARRDEVRHTAAMTRLARHFGGKPRAFEPPVPAPVRGLMAIAVENAVEGCVRETYGAVVGLAEARMSSDVRVRRAMKSIAGDECRHAELAWAVAAWIGPRLADEDRQTVERAKRDAIEALEREGDARLVRLLAMRVWAEQGQATA